ncbi:uncharacterized protein METZ01_LOCUS302301, partial [marine metagenome]
WPGRQASASRRRGSSGVRCTTSRNPMRPAYYSSARSSRSKKS